MLRRVALRSVRRIRLVRSVTMASKVQDHPMPTSDRLFWAAMAGVAVGAGLFVAKAEASMTSSAVEEIARILGPEHIETNTDELESYSHDAYSHHKGQTPRAVVYPGSTADVSAVLRICHRYRVPVIAFGGGTSLEGHTLHLDHPGITLDLSRMNRVLSVNVGDSDVTVEPGVKWEELNAALADTGLFFPVDPGPGATIGGMVATGCSGTNAVRHGTMRQNVLRLTVVLADGRVVNTAQRSRKSSAGYNLTNLFIGSEGTLGVVTEATLRLQPRPEATSVAVCAFPSVQDASRAVIRLLQEGVQVNCVELLDATMIRAINAQSGFSYPESPHLFFKFAGSKSQVASDTRRVEELVGHFGAHGLRATDDPKQQMRLWEARKVALWSAGAMRPGAHVAITDVCVPISRLAEAVEETRADIEQSPLNGFAPIVGHVGDGNFHVFLTYEPSNEREVEAAERLNERMVRRAIALGGTCTGEHGVGMGKGHFLQEELGDAAVDTMRTIKQALDPLNILNPGKIIPSPSTQPAVQHASWEDESARWERVKKMGDAAANDPALGMAMRER